MCFFFIFDNTTPVYSKTSQRPLILQWEVSHSRNTDQISLIFRQNTLELVTNTSIYQTPREKTITLGYFQSPMNPQLKKIKKDIETSYNYLKQTVPVLSLIKDSRLQIPFNPHAPVMRINEEEISSRDSRFKTLTSIISRIWKQDWICIDCAIYKKKKKSIIRTVKKLKSPETLSHFNKIKKNSKNKNQWETKTKKFSRNSLNCIPQGKRSWECIDPKFGIFEM